MLRIGTLARWSPLVLAGLIVVACSPGGSSSSSMPAGSAAGTGGQAAAAPQPVTIRYGLSGAGGATTVLRLMNEQNIWGEEGLKAEWADFNSMPLSIAALIAGEIDFAMGGAEAGVGAALKGTDIRAVGVYQNRFEYHLIAAKDIRSVQDLKGRVIGVSRFGSNADFATRVLLRRYGLDPDRGDVTIIQVGNTPERVASLQAGGIQAALMSPDVLAIMARDGYPDLVDMSKTDIRYPFQATATTLGFMAKNPGVTERVLRATYRGLKAYRDDPEAIQRILSEQSGETNKDVLQSLWESYRNAFTTDLTPEPAAFTLLLEEMSKDNPEFRNAAYSSYVDTRPVEAVNASGFPQQLLGTP